MNRIKLNGKLYAYNIKKLDEFEMLYSDNILHKFTISFYEIKYVPKWRFLFVKSNKKVKKIIPLGYSNGSFEATISISEFTIEEKEIYFVLPVISKFLLTINIKKIIKEFI